MNLLQVNHLTVAYQDKLGESIAVDNLSFALKKGQLLGIIGESGSGKSTICYSLLGLLDSRSAKVKNGEAFFAGDDLLKMDQKTLRSIRGSNISMIFQDPMTSLNPYMSIGEQVMEPVLTHQKIDRKAARQQAIQLINEMGIDDAETRFNQYPHEFSGGMRQRVMIAMALITQPDLLIADEPTSALDVTTQEQILALLKKMQRERGVSIIFISHDLSVVKKIADQVIVMEQGIAVESGDIDRVFSSPQHPYTKSLLAAIPSGPKPSAFQFVDDAVENHLEIKNVGVTFKTAEGPFKAVDDVSFQIKRGEVLGLVGESGSGKSTLSQAILRLVQIEQGEVLLNNSPLHQLEGLELKAKRKEIQMIFQDPYSSLNPRMTVYQIIAEPLLVHNLCQPNETKQRVDQLLIKVGLEPNDSGKYPHGFSGGQRQRISIARSLAVEPDLLIADEPVSALDVTIQGQILDLLMQLVSELNLTLIFISHDLAVVRYMADRIAVMQNGKIIEIGDAETIWQSPKQTYTRQLTSSFNNQ